MGIIGDLLTRKAAPATVPAKPAPPMQFLSSSQLIGKNMWSQFVDGFERNPYVFQCINIRAGSVSSVPPVIFDTAGNEITNPEHPLKKLLERPNPRQSWAQFISQVETYLGINGNAFIYPVTTHFSGIRELWCFNSGEVTPVRTNNKFEPVSAWILNFGDSTRTVTPDELIHIKLNNSSDKVFGVSPMYVARINVEMQNAAGVWNKNTLENGARPSLIMKVHGNLTSKQRKELRAEVRNKQQGPENNGNVMIIDDQMDATPNGFTAVEMDFVEGMVMNSRAICVAYNVPSELVGDVANKTYANLAEARSQYAKSCVLPELELIYGELSNYLLPWYDDVGRMTYDVAQVQDLAGDQTAMYTAITTCDFLTTNEKREIFGYDDVGSDGDVILTSMSRLPLNEAVYAVPVQPMQQDPGDGGEPDADTGESL